LSSNANNFEFNYWLPFCDLNGEYTKKGGNWSTNR